MLKSTTEPTQKEIDDHNRTHVQFRSWCKACVDGKTKEDQHRRIERQFSFQCAVVFGPGQGTDVLTPETPCYECAVVFGPGSGADVLFSRYNVLLRLQQHVFLQR